MSGIRGIRGMRITTEILFRFVSNWHERTGVVCQVEVFSEKVDCGENNDQS